MNPTKQLKDLEDRMAKLEELMVMRLFVESLPGVYRSYLFPWQIQMWRNMIIPFTPKIVDINKYVSQ